MLKVREHLIEESEAITVIVETKDLKKYYGAEPNVTKALDGVDLGIRLGSFTAIVGTSGSGKSTLLNLIGGLDYPTDGFVTVKDHTLQTMCEEELTLFRRRNIGFVFQSYNLVPILNVRENILFPADLDGREPDMHYLEDVLTMLDLTGKLDSMPGELSGGQQQRVAMARALAAKPAILLADEPTGNLDNRSSAKVMEVLRQANNQFGQTIMMITHNEKLAQQADTVVRIEDGKIVESRW